MKTRIHLVPLVILLTAIRSLAGFDDLVKSGDIHDRKHQSGEALNSYLAAEKLKPRDAALLVKIARQHALRMSDLPDKAAKLDSGRKALAYAERAVAVAPDESDPHLSVAICLGKLSPYLGNREKIEASRRIKASAERAVALDPKSDYAWHVLGRWHQELASIGGATRMLAGIIYGGLPAASKDTAVDCFKRAIALNPKRLVHVVELGRTYAMMGRKSEAARYLRKGLAMPNQDKDDPETKRRGSATLREIS